MKNTLKIIACTNIPANIAYYIFFDFRPLVGNSRSHRDLLVKLKLKGFHIFSHFHCMHGLYELFANFLIVDVCVYDILYIYITYVNFQYEKE